MSARSRLALAAGWVAVGLFLVLQVSPLVNRVTEDESTIVYDAHRVSTGQVPYRDFFFAIPPGAWFLLSGGPWGWWGRPETFARYLHVILLLGITLLLARTLRAWKGWSFPLAALLPLVLFPMSPFNAHHWFALAAYLAAISVASRIWAGADEPRLWLGMGALAAASLSILQTDGLQAVLLCAFTLMLAGGPWLRLSVRGGWLVLGGSLVIGTWVLPLLALGAGRDMAHDILWWPVVNYHKTGNLTDLPLLVDLPQRLAGLWEGAGGARLVAALSGTILMATAVLFFLGALVVSLVHLGMVVFRRRPASPALTSAAVLTVAAFGAFSRINPTWVHWVYSLVPVTFLWLIVWGERAGPRLRKAACAVAAVALLAGALYHSRDVFRGGHALWELVDVDRVDREGKLNRALRALPLLSDGDRIAVLPSGGNIYLYSYPAAIGYTYLFTLDLGHFDWEDHLRAAREIEARRPKLVLIHRITEAGFMGNDNPISRVVRGNYIRWAQTSAVIFYLRRDLHPPPSEGTEALGLPRSDDPPPEGR